MTARIRTCCASAPQPRQSPQSDQSSASQSIGQGCVLHHVLSCAWPSHSFPSCAAFTTMLRVLDLEPPPPGTEQRSLHSDQSDQTQSTGHGCVLQGFTFLGSPMQWSPLPACFCMYPRTKISWPPPHLLLHGFARSQGPHWQSWSHSCTLQRSSSLAAPSQSRPLYSSSRGALSLERVPPPHSTEQSDHGDQSFHSQSVMHSSAAQERFCTWPPWHRLSLASCKTSRDLVWKPPPQVAEQPSHGPQSAQKHSTGQSSTLQSAVSLSPSLHQAPCPICSISLARLLQWRPPPQVAEHVDHSLQAP
mmetsp:Transcript_19770/g.56549  ORF Transcript_19770/g.56549 Transcript_19770/m.56549 type:complete len:304 (+) Transcript_19770:295-1206(+)